MRTGGCSQVLSQTLGSWLADVELSADRTDRRNPVCRELFGEQYSCLFPQWIRLRLAPGSTSRLYLRAPDDHHEKLIGADQRDRWPCSHRRTSHTMTETMSEVGRERRRDP
jgi:hypothetical protein